MLISNLVVYLYNLKLLLVVCYFMCNHQGAEISVIGLVERSVIKVLILIRYQGKTNFEVQINCNASTTLLAFFEICSRSVFFYIKKRRQCGEVTAIH